MFHIMCYGTVWWWYLPGMKWISGLCFAKLLLFPHCIVVGGVSFCLLIQHNPQSPLMADGNFLLTRWLCSPDFLFVCVSFWHDWAQSWLTVMAFRVVTWWELCVHVVYVLRCFWASCCLYFPWNLWNNTKVF